MTSNPKLPNAVKYDGDKLRFDLMPPEAEVMINLVLQYGAQKYEDRNWERGGLTAKQLYNAARRHMLAMAAGERVDPATGIPHAWHAATCLIFFGTLDMRKHLEQDLFSAFGDSGLVSAVMTNPKSFYKPYDQSVDAKVEEAVKNEYPTTTLSPDIKPPFFVTNTPRPGGDRPSDKPNQREVEGKGGGNKT